MGKLTQDEICALALEAAKTIEVKNAAPYFRFDEEVARLYAKFVRAKEVIEKQESEA